MRIHKHDHGVVRQVLFGKRVARQVRLLLHYCSFSWLWSSYSPSHVVMVTVAIHSRLSCIQLIIWYTDIPSRHNVELFSIISLSLPRLFFHPTLLLLQVFPFS